MNWTWILAATDNGEWHLGIGDPTPVGWVTVAAYLLATVASGRVWLADRRARKRGEPASATFWMILTTLLLVLGINKQLDLQTLMGDVGRRMAKAQGWYENRRVYQVIFISLVTAAGLISLGVFTWLAKSQWRRNFVALMGTVFLYVFVLIRASSIHHVDIMLRWEFLGWKWNWILELGGITVVGVGAYLAWKNPGRSDEGVLWTRGPSDTTGPRRYSYRDGVPVAGPPKAPPVGRRSA
jgi:hypothetical protein